MDIYERLTLDHQQQKNLLELLMDTAGDSEKRNQLFAELKNELDSHALAEEQTFYSELMEIPEGTEEARHSVAEHKEADDLLAELKELPMSSGGWIHKFEKLKHRIVHHVDEEEEDVFVLARKLISPERAEALTAEFEQRKIAELNS